MANSLSVRSVAERYGVPPRTVLAWIANGALRALNVARRADSRRPSWRITADALQAFEAARLSAPPMRRAPRRRRPADVIEFY